jgi:parallel beta-helix repeat protein
MKMLCSCKLLPIFFILLVVISSNPIYAIHEATDTNSPINPLFSIQNAIDNADDGDIILVPPGIYDEHLTVNKSITLIGDNKTITILDGNYMGTLASITAPYVTISNLTIRNAGGSDHDTGITSNSSHTTVNNCIIYHTKHGIYSHDTTNLTISCTDIRNTGCGITIETTTDLTINNCSLSHNALGIDLQTIQHAQITACQFYTNGLACVISNTSHITISYCNISNNGDNHGGIFIDNCDQILLTTSLIYHNGIGVNIDYSSNIEIRDCQFSSNTHFSIFIKQSRNNITVTHCDITDNYRMGVYIIDRSQCLLTDNNIITTTLQGLYCRTSVCIARNNYWGSPVGPSHKVIGSGTKLSKDIGIIRYIPWRIQPFSSPQVSQVDYNYFIGEIPDDIHYPLQPTENDTDHDQVPDWWENKWGYNPTIWDDHGQLDPDGDGLNNIQEWYTDAYGSNPYHKDVFVELDWMSTDDPNTSDKPSQEVLQQVITSFAEHDITLHIDIGDLGGGEEIPLCPSEFSFGKLRDIYWDYFLHNDPLNPRKGIFHYGIICKYCPDLNFPFMGWDQYDSFAISAEWLKEEHPLIPKDDLIVGGSIHQLGSTLGLIVPIYGGNDNLETLKLFSQQWWSYHNYKSCMNYLYKYRILTYSDGSHGHGDFNDWAHLDYMFFSNSTFTL